MNELKIKTFFLSISFCAFISLAYADHNPFSGFDNDEGNKEVKREAFNPNERVASRDADNSSIWLSILALVIGCGGIGIGVIGMLKSKKNEESLTSFKKAVSVEIKNHKAQMESNAITVSTLQKSVLMMQSEERNINASKVYQNLSANASEPIKNESTQTQRENPQPVVSAPVQVRKLYSGAPINGNFTTVTSSYMRGKSLYEIMDNGSKTGQYNYLDLPDTAIIAARSLSEFLESGCVISGEKKSKFSKVKTIRPGVIRKNSGGWTIEAKALVELI